MGLSFTGYVLEKPRIGTANNPFTASPDNLISDSGAYSAVFGSDEASPGRAEYLTLAICDGDFPVAEFGWTKNEGGVQRFDFDGSEGRFRTLPGNARASLGALSSESNTTRLKVSAVPSSDSTVSPFRISLGSIGSGSSFTTNLVDTDAEFTTISTSGVVELSLATGNLNWMEEDLDTYGGQEVFFQQQAFFTLKESQGLIGTIPEVILLNPIPGQSSPGEYQVPLLRFGFGLYLTATSVANEAALTDPDPGTFQWARDTGLVRLSSTDLASNEGVPVYYDGVLFQKDILLTKLSGGTVSAPTAVSPIPSEESDLVFRAVNVSACPSGTGDLLTTSLLEDNSKDFQALGVSEGDVIRLSTGHRRLVTSVSATQLTVSPPFASIGSCSYRVEMRDLVRQFPTTLFVGAFSTSGESGKVEVNSSTGGVQFSEVDQGTYGTWSVEAIHGDLLLERGLSMRFFRSLVDLEGTVETAKDFSAFYPTVEANLADPIIGAPMVFLPVLPIDSPSYPIVVEVKQGTGSFVGVLPRLDVDNPPAGYGYTIDFGEKQLVYSFRRNLEVSQIPSLVGAWSFQPLINPTNLLFELNTGTGFLPLHLVGDPVTPPTNAGDAILDRTTGVLTFVSELGKVLVSSSGGSIESPNLNLLLDTSSDFSAVQSGALLVIPSGSEKGVYLVTEVVSQHSLTFDPPLEAPPASLVYEIRQDREVLADRFFEEVSLADPNMRVEKVRPLGTCANSPRLNISASLASVTRFRFGQETFSTAVTTVEEDSSFSAPSSLSTGSVEVSLSTGNLNFSSSDLGSSVYWVWRLTEGTDYSTSAGLGTIQLKERLLALDELLVVYPALEDNSDLSGNLVLTTERSTFLVRKELLDHPTIASVLSFNPLGRIVAPSPSPVVYRGGRPQDSSQVSIDTSTSKVTFLEDVLPTPTGMLSITDALPHGPLVGVDERVYLDYYVYNAIGGENTTVVQKPPFVLTPVTLTEGASSFTVKGDRRGEFAANYVMRVEQGQPYYLSAPSYDSATDTTTVNLLSPQVLRESASNPKLFLSSGPLNLVGTQTSPGYFVPELAAFTSVPRGMNKVNFPGSDLTSVYRTGVVVNFSSLSCNDFLIVSGASYNAELQQTEVTFSSTTPRQYTYGQCTLRRSVRPVFEASTTKVQTSSSPAIPPSSTDTPNTLLDTVVLYRRKEGEVGRILASPDDYKIDDSGSIEVTTPLEAREEISIFYTKFRLISSGQLRASYTCSVAPNESNGILNQRLVWSFSPFVPDSFYFRVETMTNFRGEVAQKYKDEAKTTSGGPRVSNSSQPKLYEQGSKSTFFEEGYLANEDLIARAVLLNYNNTIGYLEDVLLGVDGRVVGDWDGRFKFDGSLGTTVPNFASATNQIDDLVKVSNFPLPGGTYLQAYQAGSQSRFYPTKGSFVGKTVAGTNTGDQILDLGAKNVTGSGPTASRKSAIARVVKEAKAGDTTIYVDTTSGSTVPPYKPSFTTGMKIVIQDAAGTYYVTEGSPLTVSSFGADFLVVPSLPVLVPAGATVYLAQTDTTYRKNYRIGIDVTIGAEGGYLLYVKPYPPLDGSDAGVPASLRIRTPLANEILQGSVTMVNSLTAPKKIPALYGQTLDDFGDQRIPLINPSFSSEIGSDGEDLLSIQRNYASVGGFLSSASVPFVGTGVLNVGRDTITLGAGNFPSPVPQIGDLVRILDLENANSPFHRIVNVSANSVTVEGTFDYDSTGFQFLVTTATNQATGTFTSVGGTGYVTLTDTSASFLSTVTVGMTVVCTNVASPAYLRRRQVVQVLSNTQLKVDYSFDGANNPGSYRVCKPLSTFSYTDGLAALTASTTTLLGILTSNPTSEYNSLNALFDSAFTDRLTGSISATFSGDLLLAPGQDFFDREVQAGDYVYAPLPQSISGIYQVEEVVNSTTLKVKGSPSPGSVTCRVVRSFGVSEQSLLDAFSTQSGVLSFSQQVTPWLALVSTPITVLESGVPNAYYYTRGFLPDSLSTWDSQVTLRQEDLVDVVKKLDTILSSSDQLYDKRYIWIDARINLEKGLLVQKGVAVTNRIKAQEESLKALTKLLAIG